MPLSAQEFAEIDQRLRQYEFADSRDRSMVLQVLNEYRARTRLLKPDDKRLSFYGPAEATASQDTAKEASSEPIGWRAG